MYSTLSIYSRHCPDRKICKSLRLRNDSELLFALVIQCHMFARFYSVEIFSLYVSCQITARAKKCFVIALSQMTLRYLLALRFAFWTLCLARLAISTVDSKLIIHLPLHARFRGEPTLISNRNILNNSLYLGKGRTERDRHDKEPLVKFKLIGFACVVKRKFSWWCEASTSTCMQSSKAKNKNQFETHISSLHVGDEGLRQSIVIVSLLSLQFSRFVRNCFTSWMRISSTARISF